MNLQRRNILRGGLAAALTLPVAGVQAVEYTKDIKWDKTADVVVLGYGGAGACAAIEAHDAGAKVLILEKLAQGGGNTAVSSGGFMIRRTPRTPTPTSTPPTPLPTAKRTKRSSTSSARKSRAPRPSSKASSPTPSS